MYKTKPIDLKTPSSRQSTVPSQPFQPQPPVAAPTEKYTNYRVYKKSEIDFNYQNVSTSLVQNRDFSKTQEIILSDIQKEWANRVLDILENNRMYIDTSDMGSGKTFIVLYLAVKLGLPLFIICPASVEGVWIGETKNYKIPLAGIISYQSLRSTMGRQPKHGYLKRKDIDATGKPLGPTGTAGKAGTAVAGSVADSVAEDAGDSDGGIVTTFDVTSRFLKLVEKGILLIFDEFQMIKNNTAQFKASHALIKGLDAIESNSRIGLLSATPIDKPKQSINLFYIMNFISELGIENNYEEIFEKCSDIAPDVTQEIMDQYNLTDPDSRDRAIFALYEKIIKDEISGYIEPLGRQYTFKGEEILTQIKTADFTLAKKLTATLEKEVIQNDIKNGYYNLSPAAKGRLYEAVEKLNSVATFIIEKKGKVMGSNMGALTLALVEVENAKIEIFCRIGLETLAAGDRNKIIFCVNYKETVIKLREFFKTYDPLVLIGSIAKKNRPAIIATFNKNPKRRVLICNTEVGGVGISLHDTVGNSPRFMFISPSYRMLSIHQATGRTYRRGVRSNVTTRLVFGNLDGLKEEKLIAALHRKSDILRRAIRNKNTLLPDQYPDEIETKKVNKAIITAGGSGTKDSGAVDDEAADDDAASEEEIGSEGEDEYLDGEAANASEDDGDNFVGSEDDGDNSVGSDSDGEAADNDDGSADSDGGAADGEAAE